MDNTPSKLISSKYYIHHSYVDTYYYVYKFLEKWIADNIFRKDTSRVFLASDDYAFRRRFELTDMSKSYDSLEFSSLNFPFANYWPQNNGWVAETRIASKNASLVYLGIYDGDTKVRASASNISIPTTLWFDREDDARLAYEILYFKSYNEQYNSTKVPYGTDYTKLSETSSRTGNILDIPVNIKIDNLVFNPNFVESDWLKKQRIYPIKVTFTIRTFAIYPPKQPDYNVIVKEDGTIEGDNIYEDGYSYYYTVDDVILNFNPSKVNILTYDAGYDPTSESGSQYIGSTPFPSEGEAGVIYVDSFLKKDNSDPSIYIWNELEKKYIVPSYQEDGLYTRVHSEIKDTNPLNISRFDCMSNVTQTTNTLEWEYGDSTTEGYIASIEIHLANKGEVYILNKEDIEFKDGVYRYKIKGLQSNTQYFGYIVYKAKNDEYRKFPISFITSISNKKISTKKNKDSSLVGVSW